MAKKKTSPRIATKAAMLNDRFTRAMKKMLVAYWELAILQTEIESVSMSALSQSEPEKRKK